MISESIMTFKKFSIITFIALTLLGCEKEDRQEDLNQNIATPSSEEQDPPLSDAAIYMDETVDKTTLPGEKIVNEVHELQIPVTKETD